MHIRAQMWNLAPQSHVVSCCSTSYDGTARSVPGLGPNVAHNHRRGPGPLCRMYVAEKQRRVPVATVHDILTESRDVPNQCRCLEDISRRIPLPYPMPSRFSFGDFP